MKKILSVILTLCFCLSFFGCGKEEEDAQDTSATKVTVYKITNEDIISTVSYTGEIKAEDEGYVSPKSAGTVKSIYADIGDYVSIGQTLAVLDDTDYRLAYNQALAAYNSALASYNSVTNGSLKQTDNQLKSAVSSAEIEYNNARDNYNRQKALYDAGAISKVTLESAETRYKNAEINYNSAKSSYNITVNEVNKDSEKSAKAGVESARAALETAENSLKNTVVTAPISGYIASNNANIGQMATQGSPLFIIKSSDNVNAEVSVTESVIPYISIGTEANVSVESAGIENIGGKVTEVNTVKDDKTGMYTVRISIDNKDGKLKIGMFANISLNTQSVKGAVAVPSDSLILEDDSYYVYVANGDKAEKRKVEVGVENNEFTQITSGVKSGESVVVTGKEYLSEQNNKIKIVEG